MVLTVCQVWDLFEGGRLFSGTDPELGTYRGRAHLAEMIALLGPPGLELINRGRLKWKFFTGAGKFHFDTINLAQDRF